MITKIKAISNFAVFDNFAWDTSVLDKNGQPLVFSKLNILYGRNYSGKTTLSRIFRALETHLLPEKYDSPQFEVVTENGQSIKQDNLASINLSVRVFNEDFIRANLRFLIDPDSEIAPFAILGADNAETEKAIKDLEVEIGSDIDTHETGLYKKLKELKAAAQKAQKDYSTDFNSLESKLSDKATNKRTGIKYNVNRYGDQNYNIAKIKQEIAVVTASTYTHLSADKKVEYESTILEQEKSDIQSLSIPSLLLNSYCQRASVLLSQQIGASNKIPELLLNVALNDWVKQGANILKGQKICAFCGSPITDERWVVIHAHFDEESKKLESEIDDLVSQINLEKALLHKPLQIDKSTFYTKYCQKIDDYLKTWEEAVQQYCQSLDKIFERLQDRKSQITVPIQFIFPEDNSAILRKAINEFNAIIKENNEFSSKLASAKTVAYKALRLQEVADYCATIEYEKIIKQISILESKHDKANETASTEEETLSIKKQKLQEKRRQLNDEEEGARRVNKYLNDYFGHNFVTLEAEKVTEGEKRIKFKIMRNGKPAYNLSGGECSLISFCYFMAKLDDINTQGTKPIIWIDDPISSLDGNHIYFMYSLIVARIAKTGNFEQLFISTHNLDFLKYLKRLNSYQPNTKNEMKALSKQYFLIEREGKLSKLLKMPNYLARNATEFNYLFSIIYKCSKCENVTDDNYDMLYGFGNSARKFLEMLLYFQFPDDSEELLPKLKRFFKDEEIPPILMDRMFNEDSHGSSPERSLKVDVDPETIPVAKKVIEKLQENKAQFNALLNSIGETPSP